MRDFVDYIYSYNPCYPYNEGLCKNVHVSCLDLNGPVALQLPQVMILLVGIGLSEHRAQSQSSVLHCQCWD